MIRDPQVEAAVAARMQATASALESAAKALCPRKTGFLEQSIRVLEAGADGCEVGSDADYAEAVELGTHKKAAQPFLRPAIDRARPQIRAIWSG